MADREADKLLAATFPFWDELSAGDRADVRSHTRFACFEDGAYVQGAKGGCAGVVFVLAGGLRAYLLGESGREITLFRLGPGECCVLAASCIMPMVSFDITLDAMGKTSVVIVDPACFARVALENVPLEAFMYRQATERFADVLRVMQRTLFSDVNARLASFLLEESARRRSAQVRMTHEEIARHVGSAREVVTRALKQFAGAGAVRLSRGVVEVIDGRKLEQLCPPL